ncbi:MAG: response regulator [Gammaproteobacteria bacterium]|jgi:two-component system cell cycle response regulator
MDIDDSAHKIMLVDGSESARKMVGQLLKKGIDNAEITSFTSAREALAHLQFEDFDLITTALALPDMDGVEFTRQLRDIPGRQHVPVVVVSGDADSRQQEDAHQAGATGYFDKARGLKALVDYLKGVLGVSPIRQGGHVLYIEDSATAAAAVRQILEIHEIDVTHVLSAEDGLELLRRDGLESPKGYDIVISDLFLRGDMTGIHLTRIIRNEMRLSPLQMPVLLVTVSGNEPEEYVKLLKSGANDFVTKPVIEEILMARVNMLLALKQLYLEQHPAQPASALNA